jgi:putative chitinase
VIDRKAFKAFIPHSKYSDQWYDTLFGAQTELDGRSLLEDYEINTPKRIAAFLAQTHHESGGYVWLTENLNYSADGLLRVFPKYFKTMEIAKAYARQPDKIANRTYADRMGNGDEASGDGSKYKGRGLIQLTFKNNYFWFAASLEITPEEASEYTQSFEGAAQSACWYWSENRLNRFCDANDIKGLSKAINGGFKGLEDREVQYARALRLLGV